MTIDSDKILHDLLNSLDSLEGIRPGEIPNIALYMDQVTTFMDAQLASSRRFESDKVLTKTMINNYTKNHLLPLLTRRNIPENTLQLHRGKTTAQGFELFRVSECRALPPNRKSGSTDR